MHEQYVQLAQVIAPLDLDKSVTAESRDSYYLELPDRGLELNDDSTHDRTSYEDDARKDQDAQSLSFRSRH